MNLRPMRPNMACLVLVLLAMAFFGISRTSGAGWATVLVAGVVGAVILGVAAPGLVVRRAKLKIDAPEAATVGTPLDMQVVGRGSVVAEIITLGTGRFPLYSGTLTTVPTRRGVFRHVQVHVTSSAPLGLVPWRRRFTIDLGREREIGPAPLASPTPVVRKARDVGDEDVRSTREYQPGDTFKSVHWPATARTGALIVRQTDAPVAPDVIIAVDLTGDHDIAETRASRAAGLALAALASGAGVTLATYEASGPVTASVTSARAVNARLARAIAGSLNLPSDEDVIYA